MQKNFKLLFKIIDSASLIDILGLPLGNTISQICANIYMNVVDQYAKRGLSLKYYVRYADDVVIILKDKDEANRTLSLIRKHVETRLHLKFNDDKTKIFPIVQGVNTIGFKIYPTHMLLRNYSKKRIKKKLSKMKRLLIEQHMSVEKAEQILNSWLGHAKQADSYSFVNKLLNKYDFINLESKTFKINRGVISDERTVSKGQ